MNKEEVLNSYFGQIKLKEVQEEIIDSVINGNEIIGLLPTGYGKSLTFIIPALIFDGITIVITPLISLMQDQVKKLKEKKIKAEYISSLLDMYEINNIYDRLVRGKIKILYIAGERLLSNRFLNAISKIEISLIVFDEAHTLLWSEDFRQSLGKVNEFISALPYRPKLMALTATATELTVNKITEIAGLNNPKLIKINCDRPNIFYKIIKSKNKNKDLINYLNDNIDEKGIIYTLTVRKCEELYEMLACLGYKVLRYHGAMSNEEKKKSYKDFLSDEYKILICTNSFGMGIDILLRYVVEYDMPASIEDFSQQTGRASRDGKYGEGIVLYNENDIKTIEYFIENIENKNLNEKDNRQIRKERYNKLDSIISLCMSSRCIHKVVSNYFGFYHSGKCYMCSNCVRIKK